MSAGFRHSVSVTAEGAMSLYKKLELKTSEQSGHLTFKVAKQPENLSLNRWHNVLPYDTTRVKLEPPYHGKFSTDYINASYVKVEEADRCYVLTQGPLKETVWHFWYMVLKSQSDAIIMLCRLTENGMCKCAKYWPDTTNPDDVARDPYTGIEIRLLSEEESHEITIRKIELCHEDSHTVRIVTQFHYNKWPDFGVPTEPSSFLYLLRKVSNEHPSIVDRPNIVHCSAGIGRSGTFCLVDSCIQIMSKRQEPMTRDEILETLIKMRLCRGGLVQTPDQLRFTLQSLSVAMENMDFSNNGNINLSLTNGKNSEALNVSDLPGSIPSMKEEESSNKNGGSKFKHARKRSTGDDPDSDHALESNPSSKVNGESQAKRSKGTKDW